jgi:hypothetical protein
MHKPVQGMTEAQAKRAVEVVKRFVKETCPGVWCSVERIEEQPHPKKITLAFSILIVDNDN